MTKKEFAKLLFEKGVFTTRTEAELEIVERAPRLGRNPKTGEEVKIGKRKSVKFRPGKAFLEKLN